MSLARWLIGMGPEKVVMAELSVNDPIPGALATASGGVTYAVVTEEAMKKNNSKRGSFSWKGRINELYLKRIKSDAGGCYIDELSESKPGSEPVDEVDRQ